MDNPCAARLDKHAIPHVIKLRHIRDGLINPREARVVRGKGGPMAPEAQMTAEPTAAAAMAEADVEAAMDAVVPTAAASVAVATAASATPASAVVAATSEPAPGAVAAEAAVPAAAAQADIEAAVDAVAATAGASTAGASVTAATAGASTAPASAMAEATSEPVGGRAADMVLLGHLLTSQLMGGLRHESPTPGCSLETDLARFWKDGILPIARRTDCQVVILWALLLLLAMGILGVFLGVYYLI